MGMAQAVEQVLVQTFISHPAIECFNKPGLHGLARHDAVPFDLAVLLPFQDQRCRSIPSIVWDRHAGMASYLGKPVQLAADAQA